MKNFYGAMIVGFALVLSACGRNPGAENGDFEPRAHDGKGGDHDEHGAGVTYEEARGLRLNPEIVHALGVKTTAAASRPLREEKELLAQVFAIQPEILAVASVPEAQARHLEQSSFTDARLARMDRTSAPATGRADLVFALHRDPPPRLGEFVSVRPAGPARTVLTVPCSALLDAASGTFVYVVNEGHYLRTPVRVGASSGAYIEIVDGLRPDDVVVASPVEQLWLAELRLTRGGGHSH